jgi:DNA polymerase III delta prime subunit
MAPLTEKLRPRTLDKVHGNREAVTKLSQWLIAPMKHQTLLFLGPNGCGKNTLAFITAEELGAPVGSYHCHITKVSQYTVETFRDIAEGMGRGFFCAKAPHWDIYLYDEAQTIPPLAQAILLQKAENPPERTIIMFLSSEPEKLSPGLRNRCMEFELRPLSRSETVSLLKKACEVEGGQLEEEVLKGIANEVQGNPRSALIRLGEELNRQTAKRKEGNDE